MVGAECLTRLTIAVIRRGATDGLDTACVSAVRRLPFVTAAGP